MAMRKFSHKTYHHPEGCGPLALLQVTEAPEQAVMSAMILAGYSPYTGGTTAEMMETAAKFVGVKLGCPLVPSEPCPVGKLAEEFPTGTYLVSVAKHVFAMRGGTKLEEPARTPGYELVEFVWPVEKGALH